MSKKINLAVLVSGRGSNLQSLIDCQEQGLLDAQIQLVVSNKEDAPALHRARIAGIPLRALPAAPHEKREDYDRRLKTCLEEHEIDLVVLAGFMRILSQDFVQHYWGRILNIHPSLLPSFPGLHAQKQALEHGVRYTGCTVHFVDGGCDTGPIVLQEVVPVIPGDTEETLSKRILEKEHLLLPQAVNLVANQKVKILNSKVVFV